MSSPYHHPLCSVCLQPLTVSWPQQKHVCKAVPVGPVLTCIPSEELDRLRAEVDDLKHERDRYKYERDLAVHANYSIAADLTQQLAAANGRVERMREVLAGDHEQARKWAWGETRKDLDAEKWTVSESANYFGFFHYGWQAMQQLMQQRFAALSDLPEDKSSQ